MYGRRWYAETRLFLRVNPICVGLPDGTHHWKCNGAATLVDHLIPHRGDLEVFWQTDGWRAMNRHCHDLKTLLHDGGFGRERRPPTEGTP
jgi:5-methylcytosine-specific restriction protein A